MNDSDTSDDGFDFKPFFDLVVGVLFVLLILIASQLFFARFDVVDTSVQDQQKAEQAFNDERAALLTRIVATLGAGGIEAVAAPNAWSVSMRWPHDRPTDEVAAVISQAIARDVACATDSHRGRQGCVEVRYLGVTELGLDLSGGLARPGLDLEASQALAALALANGLLKAQPTLLSLRRRDGGYVLPPPLVTSNPGPAVATWGLTIRIKSRRLQ
jgi:hypothetical protein